MHGSTGDGGGTVIPNSLDTKLTYCCVPSASYKISW